MSLQNKTLLITGSSRGIGKAIALRAARDGANVIIVAKTTEPHPKLEGTIYTAAEEVEKAGGKALAVKTDLRFEEEIQNAVQKGVEAFGGIDILVNNASALMISTTTQTPLKKYDLLQQVNVRGTFATSQACLPFLAKAKNPHILNISPPLNLNPKWFAQSLPYTMSKYGMSMCVLGMAAEFKEQKIAVNALWPQTLIATAPIYNLLGGEKMANKGRKPSFVGEAAYWVLTQSSAECTGNFFTDEEVMKKKGVEDFTPYAVDPTQELQKDFFLD